MGSNNLLLRDDTFFGVCQGLGEDLGIHPNILRTALALFTFYSPVAALGLYAAMAAAVLASRLIFPDPRAKAPARAPEAAVQAAVEAEAQGAAELADLDHLPIAA